MAPAHQVNSDNVVDAVPPSWDSACQWGRWSLQRDNWTLVYQEEDYAIDLEDCNTSAELLDWILQIERKSWATPQVLADLLHALCDIFDPQANLCSGGISQPRCGSLASSQD